MPPWPSWTPPSRKLRNNGSGPARPARFWPGRDGQRLGRARRAAAARARRHGAGLGQGAGATGGLRLGQLPALRQLVDDGPAASAQELHRHRQGAPGVPRVPDPAGRIRGTCKMARMVRLAQLSDLHEVRGGCVCHEKRDHIHDSDFRTAEIYEARNHEWV